MPFPAAAPEVAAPPPGDHGPTAPTRVGAAWMPALLLALLYFGAQVAMRVGVSTALELDEAEQALWTQSWALGYGPQPPLYTWLQKAVFVLTGPSVLGLALLKNTLLATTYASLWLAGRRLMPAPLAATAALCPLLMLQVGWESQRDLTHSVLVTTMAALSFWLALRLIEQPRQPIRWIALGAAVGAGLLSKYSFAGVAVVFAAAFLGTAEGRAALRGARPFTGPVLLLVTAAVVVAPHAVWLAEHAEAARQHATGKLAGGNLSWLAGRARGLATALLAAVAGLSPLWLLLLAVFGPRPWRAAPAADGDPAAWRRCDFARRLGRGHALALAGVFAALVLVGGATHFKDRWLMPFLIVVPVLLFAAAPSLLHHPRRRHWHRLCAVAALLWLGLVGLRVVADGQRGRPDELNEPAAALTSALRASGAVPDGPFTLLSNDRVLGGALRLAFPQAAVRIERRPDAAARPAAAGPVLAVVRGDDAQARALHLAWASRLGRTVGSSSADGAWRLPPLYARHDAAPLVYHVSRSR